MVAGFIVQSCSDHALKRECLILGERAKFNAEMARFARRDSGHR
jgi:hypothetical protein